MVPGGKMAPNGGPNRTAQDRNLTMLTALYLASSETMHFTIGQPEDPKYANNDTLSEWERNRTDMTTSFRQDSRLADELQYTQSDARGYLAKVKNDSSKKWRIGVGVGVGLGVPLVAAVMFLVGKSVGQKKASRSHVKTADS